MSGERTVESSNNTFFQLSRKDKLILSETLIRKLWTEECAITLLDEVDPDAEMSDAASDLVFEYASYPNEEVLPFILSLLTGL